VGGVYIIEDVETSYWTKGGLYGYPTNYGYKHPNSIIEIFKTAVDCLNGEFAQNAQTSVQHVDEIGSIVFAKNCIVITKKQKENKRIYRFAHCL
jgi:ribosomal protein L5